MKNLQSLFLAITAVLLTTFSLTAELSAQDLNDDGSSHTINANGASQHQGSTQDYTIPSNPSYNSINFTLTGGAGGYAKVGDCQSNGGSGATIEAVFWIGNGTYDLKPGGTIRFIVGKGGESSYNSVNTDGLGSGGGGGTAVLYRPTSNDPWVMLAVAGGGGGAYQGGYLGACLDSQKGAGGNTVEDGSAGEGNNAGDGGVNGAGGGTQGGGGYLSDGGDPTAGGGKGYSSGGTGGIYYVDGGWGFGGGGGGGHADPSGGTSGGGGGGGYSGGGGGGIYDNGGGGGSYVHSLYAISSTKMAGTKGGGTSQNGHVDYAFDDIVFTWTGSANTSWTNPANWQSNIVPVSSSPVVIPSGVPNYPIITSTVTIKSLDIQANAELAVSTNGILNVNNSDGIGVKVSGTLTNSGLIQINNTDGNGLAIMGATNATTFLYGDTYIGNTGSIGGDGIYVEGHLLIDKDPANTNQTDLDPTVTINNVSGNGISCFNGEITIDQTSYGSFEPTVTIDIGTSGTIGNIGIANTKSINLIQGTINIQNTTSQGLYNTSFIGNYGYIDIGTGGTLSIGSASNAIGDFGIENKPNCTISNSGTIAIRNITASGIWNEGIFTNNASGHILVDQTTSWGILHHAGTFSNSGTITIGSQATVSVDGLQTRTTFNNNSSGTININRANRHGLYHYHGTFTNQGLIKIGENGSIGNSAINNATGPNPIFLNSGCGAVIQIFDKNIQDSHNSFTNSGTILQESAASSNIETNNGIILYNAGSFTADNGNTPVSVSGSFSGKKIWTGCGGDAWQDPVSWYPGGTTTASDEVVIYPVGIDPVIGNSAQANSVLVAEGGHLFNNDILAVTQGDLYLATGATIEGSGQYDLSGNFTVNGGTFLPGTSTVTMMGTADLKAIGNDFISFHNLVIDKPFDKTVNIQSPVYVSNDLTINSGDLTVNATLTCPFLHLPNGTDLTNAGNIVLSDGAGSFWIQSGASAQGNGYYYISGDFKVDGGTFTPGTSVVTLNGGGNQTISQDPINFYDLVVDKSSGAVILDAGTATVSNNLYMFSGNLDLNGSDLELTGNGTIIGENPASYIYSTNGGVVKKTVDLNAPASVNPGNIGVSITSPANLGSTTIQRGHEEQIINGSGSILRYYDIAPANNSGLDATVRFSYLDHELNGIVEGDLSAYRFNGADWDYFAASANDATANWVETENVDAFSKWTLATDCPPILYYADTDGDGYGDPAVTVFTCIAPVGYVADNTDCNDTDANVNPNPNCSTTTRTWTGHISSDWEEACNWSPSCIPTANEDVVIPDVTNGPVIFGTTAGAARMLTIQAGGLLTINGGGSLTQSAELVINGVLTIQSGGSVSANAVDVNSGAVLTNNGTITCATLFQNNSGGTMQGDGLYAVAGDWNNNGTFNIGSSKVRLNGAATSSIGGQFSIKPFYDLEIDKSGGAEVSTTVNITLANDLVMLQGNFNVSGFMTINGEIVNESSDRYVYGTGTLLKTMSLNAPTAVNPGNLGVTITSSADLGSTSIRRRHLAQEINGVMGIVRYYDIAPANNSGLDATVRFSYLDHELNGIAENELVPYSSNGTDWDEYPVIASDAAANWVETDNVDVFSEWTLAACNLETYYADMDGDGYGDPAVSVVDCVAPGGYVADNTDCDDSDADEFPGQTWYIDADSDGYGGSSTTACERPTNGKTAAEIIGTGTDDCDDANAAINPGAENCNGLNISGTIIWEHDGVSGVNNATVNVTGAGNGSGTSDTNGDYVVNIPSGTGNFTVKPVKNINKLNGVTVADATAIQQHVASLVIITDPYKLVAADVNKSNSISTLDASIIKQALLGNQAALAQFKTSWRFVPVSYNLQAPPWGFPETIGLASVSGSVPGQDFYGIKTGDVVSEFADPASLQARPPLVLRAQDAVLQAGQAITTTVRTDGFDDLAAWQFALQYDPKRLALRGVKPLSGLPLSAADFGTSGLAEGELRSVWSQAEGVALDAEAQVFELQFEVLQGGGRLSDALWLDPVGGEAEELPGLAFNSGRQASAVALRFDQASGTDGPAVAGDWQLLQNQPNPFTDETTIGFVLPAGGCQAQLRLYDAAGKLLWTADKTYAGGYNAERVQLAGITAAGVLYYELTTPFGVRTRRMVRVYP